MERKSAKKAWLGFCRRHSLADYMAYAYNPAVNRSNRLPENKIVELIDEIKQGRNEEENFRLLYENFCNQVHWFFHRKGESQENVSELTQTTFLSVYKGLKEFRHDSTFFTWLLRLAGNVFKDEIDRRNAIRRKAIVVSLDEKSREDSEDSRSLTDTLADTSPDQLQVFSKKERANKLHEAVQELPPKMRQCLQLHIAEASNKEIASVMGITEDTVKAHINQSKEKLKEKLSRYFESMDF